MGEQLSLEAPKRRSYSEAEIAGAVLAVEANRGYVKPVADKLGLQARTLDRWTKGERRAGGAADRALMVHKQEQELLNRFLENALLTQELSVSPEKLAKASSYQLTLEAGINYDKYLLGTGRPTSRTESLRARYVEPGALRSLARTVLDLPALPSHAAPQRGRGVSGKPAASHLADKEKTKAGRTKRSSKNALLDSQVREVGSVIPQQPPVTDYTDK